MRKAIFIICGIQATICLVYLIAAFTISSDAAGEGMARGFALIGSIAVATTYRTIPLHNDINKP